MSHEQAIRFSQPVRMIRIGDPNAPLQSGLSASVGSAAETAAQLAALGESLVEKEREEERAAIASAVASLAEATVSLASQQRELLAEMQRVAVELAVAIASRVTYDKLETDRFAVESLAREVFTRLAPKGPGQVRLHPDDLELLKRRLGESQPLFADLEVLLVADASLMRGDCMAQADDVSVLSQLESQLDGIRQHLLRSLPDAEVERRKTMPGGRELRRFPDRRQTA